MKKQTIQKIFEILRAGNPHPKSDLIYTDPYTLLVAVVLSAQTTDKGVNAVTPALFAAADTPAKMAALGPEKIHPFIKTVGLAPTKAKNVAALSHILATQYNGQVPDTFEKLVALPGVGRKTANVVLNIAFEHPTIAVDTHVHRVANRLGLSDSATPDGVEDDLHRVVPTEFLPHAHHWLLLHGRYTCTARAPKCGTCVIAHLCGFTGKTTPLK